MLFYKTMPMRLPYLPSPSFIREPTLLPKVLELIKFCDKFVEVVTRNSVSLYGMKNNEAERHKCSNSSIWLLMEENFKHSHIYNLTFIFHLGVCLSVNCYPWVKYTPNLFVVSLLDPEAHNSQTLKK